MRRKRIQKINSKIVLGIAMNRLIVIFLTRAHVEREFDFEFLPFFACRKLEAGLNAQADGKLVCALLNCLDNFPLPTPKIKTTFAPV